MVADIDIGLALVKVFAAQGWIANEREHAKYPGPIHKEFVTDPGVFPTEKEWENDAGKQDQHKHGEDQQNPKCKQFETKRSDDFQNLPLEILRKF